MNILTFDIEDWYNCDFISDDFDWDKFEVRIYEGVERILEELATRNLKGTFFCLGWLAEKHPSVVRKIHNAGHQIGCHSYQHQLSTRFSPATFRNDTYKAKLLIEDVVGNEVDCFRAPGFSITQNNIWALGVLCELGFKYDCSVFPAHHDYGGFPDYGMAEPALLKYKEYFIKEFPINVHSILGHNLVFSGGGFFRLFPYWLIRYWGRQTSYMMTYFHPRDFDSEQPVIKSLPTLRRFKSYVGLKKAFPKFQRLLTDFDFVNVADADLLVNWATAREIAL